MQKAYPIYCKIKSLYSTSIVQLIPIFFHNFFALLHVNSSFLLIKYFIWKEFICIILFITSRTLKKKNSIIIIIFIIQYLLFI